MKYLAILKDSWREALDTWVLYALVVLSGLVILAVASISFTPRTAEKGVEDIAARFAGAQAQLGMPPPPLRYEVADFAQLDEKPPWEAAFRFDLVVREVVLKDREGKVVPTEGAFRSFVWLSALQLDEAKLNDEDREARQRVVRLQQQAQAVRPDKLEQFLNDKMREEIAQVTPAQMERFVREQLASHGTLEATTVTYKKVDGAAAAFAVEASPRAETFRTWPHAVSYGFGAYKGSGEVPIGLLVYGVEGTLIGSFGAGITMLVASVVTAFFIPNMLRKGTVDLLVSKPVRRPTLLVYKYVGGLTFMFLTTVVTVVGVWLVLGLRSGLWAPGFLLSIFILTFQFAIFYAISTVVGVLTRSPIVAILAACLGWVVLWAVGSLHLFLDATRDLGDLRPLPQWVYTTGDAAHFVLPRYKDLDALNDRLIARDLLGPDSPQRKQMDFLYGSIQWGPSLGFTVGFIAVLLGLASWRFATKDY